MLGFQVDLSDVGPDDPQGKELDAGQEREDADDGSPAGYGGTGEALEKGPEAGQEAEERHDKAQDGDPADGLDRKGGDPVEGQAQHLGQRVVGLPGHPLLPLVEDLVRGKAHQGDHPPEEEVDFLEVGKLLEDPVGDEPVVRVVVYRLHPHGSQELVKGFSGEALEEGVAGPVRTDAIDYLHTGQVLVHHGIHSGDVVLAIAVNGDGDVHLALGLHEAGQDGVLVAPVPGLAHTDEDLILVRQFFDDFPGPVLGPVVHKKDPGPG